MHDPKPPYPWTGNAILSSARAETTIPLDPRHCLLLRPPTGEQLDTGMPTTQIGPAEVRLLNLRTYGFAVDYIFTHAQQDAMAIRADAKRHPDRVVRPRPSHQVMLIDAEPGDDRLAREHRSRGWPERLMVKGQPHDYLVLDETEQSVERSIDLSILSKQRAIRRLGTGDLRESNIALDPRDLMPIPGLGM